MSGGSLPPQAFVAKIIVVLLRPGPLVVRVDRNPFLPITFPLTGSSHIEVSSRL